MRLRDRIAFGLLAVSSAACQGERTAGDPWAVTSTASVPDSTTTVLHFANRKTLKLPLRDVTIHGTLIGASPVPWIVLSGWSCTDCDAVVEVFVVKADTVLGEKWIPSYSFPGDQFSDGSDSATSRRRLFLGACVPSLPPSAVWFEETRDSTQAWRRRARLLVPRAALIDSQIALTAEVEAAVLNAARTPLCHEIPGRQQYLY